MSLTMRIVLLAHLKSHISSLQSITRLSMLRIWGSVEQKQLFSFERYEIGFSLEFSVWELFEHNFYLSWVG